MSEISKLINQIIKEGLAPLLKKEGFKKTGHNFYRELSNRTEVLNIQASRWNEKSEGEFTVNLGVYFPEIAHITEAIPFKGMPKEYNCTVNKRIGHLLENGCDHWWKISPSANLNHLAEDLTQKVKKYGLPWLEKMADLNILKEELKNNNRAFVASGVALLLNSKQDALNYLQLAYKQQPLASENIKAWGIKHELIKA